MKDFLATLGSLAKRHWPTIVAFLIAFWAQFGGQITAYISAHPKYSAVFAAVSWTVTYYLRSPLPRKEWTDEERAEKLNPPQS